MKNYKQEMFTKVYRHLLTQKKKSMKQLRNFGADGGADSYTGSCAYRGDNGTMCAVGCLISDKKYDESIEGRGVRNSVVQRAIPKRYTPYTGLLGDLQRIHDFAYIKDWKFELEALATRNNLKIPKLVK